MYSRQQMLDIAKAQSALELGCVPADFDRDTPSLVTPVCDPRARRYLRQPFVCQLVSYGRGIVAAVRPDLQPAIAGYLHRWDAAHCMETPALYDLNDRLAPAGLRVRYMAEYFLPDPAALHPLPCACETAVLTQADFAGLYTDDWVNALCRDRAELDVLGVGAYEHGKLIGLAACSADCDDMWQIGVNVLPQARRRGIAAALTSRLALEILRRGKVPFYCCAWCNLTSARNAIRCGFRPAWAELTAWPVEPGARFDLTES